MSAILLGVAFVLGLKVGDAADASTTGLAAVRWHFLTSLGALVFAALVHAIVLTYFMGTGRWIEDTTNAYQLGDRWRLASRALKSRAIPAMMAALLLLVLAGASGAGVDPAATVRFAGWAGISGGTIHLIAATAAIATNLAVNGLEVAVIAQNGRLIDEILGEVKRMREERGLPV
jgi:hypothetical protein